MASLLYLPAASGYMIGGMIVGPSGLKLIDNVVQVGPSSGSLSPSQEAPTCCVEKERVQGEGGERGNDRLIGGR